MGTRAIIMFRDKPSEGGAEFKVYKHWDGDPETVGDCLTKALSLAWPLPRFEADEFAASFVAANKDGAGDIRLAKEMGLGEEYRYLVTQREDDKLVVECMDGDGRRLWLGTWETFLDAAKHGAIYG